MITKLQEETMILNKLSRFNKKNVLLLFFILTISILPIGCSSSQEPGVELSIAAASDLILAFNELGNLYEQEHGVKIVFSFGSTGQLADQIENGAPFDVFAAADIQFIDHLQKKNMIISETQKLYAVGQIGIASLPNSNLELHRLEDLLQANIKKVAIANPEHAPYGRAAKQALVSAGVWDQLEEKIVYGRNISDTLTLIETGNAEAGIIALSLANPEKMDFQQIDEQLHQPLEQAIAVIQGTKEQELAQGFIDFIHGPVGKPIMEKYGFIVPKEN